MPTWMDNTRKLLDKVGLQDSEIILRMTGCPNGCARPYMAELALVGDGPETYQLWLGGNPGLTQLGTVYANKVKWEDVDRTLEPLFVYWKHNRLANESFGEFTARIPHAELQRFSTSYHQL